MAALDIGSDPQHESGALDPFRPSEVPIFVFLLVKLASRCNIACTYCYWFRDADVYKKPAVLTCEAEDAFCLRLEEHIQQNNLQEFEIVFHGGEPLLFPKRRFADLQLKLLAIEARTGCRIKRGVCTNAMLVDDEWVAIFKDYDVQVSVSLDGPPDLHDARRVDFRGRGTHADVMRGIQCLWTAGIDPA